MPGYQQDVDMEFCTDKVLSKGRILQELTRAVKLVYAQSLHGTVVLDGDSRLVYWLDRALRHGLRIERHGYWGTARELSHQDTVVVIHALQNVLTSIGKGRAWLYHTLSEGSFESYLACMLRDVKTLKKQYFPHALVRDADRTNQLINLLVGLENVSFTLQLDVTYLDICNYMTQHPMSGSPSGTALSLHLRTVSLSSSLASPGDSGVALDSDMDAANETDTSSYKEDCNFYVNDTMDTNCASKATDCENNGILLNSSYGNSPHYYYSSVEPVTGGTGYSFKRVTTGLKTDQSRPHGNSYVINNETNLLELSMTISDCDNAEASYNILDAISMVPSSILSSSSSEVSVQLRQQRKKKRSETKKRVSFHEDIFKMMKLDDDENYVDCCSPSSASYGGGATCYAQQRVKRELPQKSRYSWCANGDYSPYVRRGTVGPRRNAFSDCYSSTSSLSIFDGSDAERKSGRVDHENNYQEDGDDTEVQEAMTCACIAMAERGVPEGREEPMGAPVRCKIELELEENEALEAYTVEEECGVVHEDPLVKLEMPTLPDANGGKPLGKYASSNDWSDLESVTTISDNPEDRRGSVSAASTCSNNNNNNNNNNNTTTNNNNNNSNNNRHLASPVRRRNTTTAILSSGESSRFMPAGTQPAAMRQAPSKSSLLSRFLRSITERKFESKRDRRMTSKSSHGMALLVKRSKVDPALLKEFDDSLAKEIREAAAPGERELSGEIVGAKVRETLRRSIYRDKTEVLYKVYKVRSSYMTNGESKPMLALLTDKTLYLTGSKGGLTYSNHFVIPYNELDVILVNKLQIGPNAQTVLISNADYEMQYLFSTGSKRTTSELIGHLEMAMRGSPSKPRLPAVKELHYDDMHMLRHSILADTAVHADEKIEHYSLIFMEDEHISPPTSPCGPTKEGDLMFRSHSYVSGSTSAASPWEAGYFVLKGGVVYMFTDSNQRLPRRAIPLKGGLCQGCRRIPNSHRPHTFEILLKPNKSFQFAAPDEYVASEWLQSFIQSASGLFDCSENRDPLPCSLIVTSGHLVAMKEVFPGTQRGQTLSCASIEDLSAFRVPLSQQSWCILEFACREVHESSGDWVVYFSSHREQRAFQRVLERLWTNAKLGEFPVSSLPAEEKLYSRCSSANKALEQAWQHLLPSETD
ncbi:uncharacterized protein LOC106637564 isoform X2 [Copidosoma floridanum]|uniref:uncharacterized protein LOC106637564 isoform X2 n=1 Tax=Copidosoma floridanum TaxID=29053 RepID=UPI000C6F97E6|nr:uncharacterized protein LOC106637564 isoform X2 [Copidosoma floridanum]